MLKRPITYTDFNDNQITEVFYFNLSQTELTRLDVSRKGGLHAFLTNIVEEQDPEKLWNEFEKLILMTYGEKSDDGKRFIKNQELVDSFRDHAAFDALITELTTQAGKAAEFVNGVIPKNLSETPQDKPTGPPLPPVRS